MAPWIQDDWRINNKMTVNLGFRWDFNGSVKEADNMLNYAFDPTIVNPGVGARRPAGHGRHQVRRRGRRPGPALEVRQEQLSVPRRHGVLRSTRRPCSAPATASPSSTRRASRSTTGSVWPRRSSVQRRQPDADLRSVESLAQRHPGAAGKLARRAHVPRPRSELLEPGLHRPERAPVLGRVSSASCRGACRSRRPTLAAAATTSKATSVATMSRPRRSRRSAT